jgi:hypothetical protein
MRHPMTPARNRNKGRAPAPERFAKAPGLLERLGYAPDEIHYGWLLSAGSMCVPAVVGDEARWLLLDTGRRLDLVLNLDHVTSWGWPCERKSEVWGRSPLPSFFALGRGRAGDTVEVAGKEGPVTKLYATCGRLGAPFFRDTVLAIDPVDATVGVSSTLDLASRSDGALGIPLVANAHDNLPITEALEDTNSSGVAPRLVIDTTLARSVVSLEYIDRAWKSDRLRRKAREAQRTKCRIDVSLRVPEWKKVVGLEAHVWASTNASYTEATGLTIDGYLGIDFLYRWLPLIDFRQWILWLAPMEL